MDELVRWLGDELDFDERIARACAGGGRWAAADIAIYGPGLLPEVRCHMAEHDPARVLREIEGARKLIGRYVALTSGVLVMTGAEAILSEYRRVILPNLALPYVDRPGYAEALASVA